MKKYWTSRCRVMGVDGRPPTWRVTLQELEAFEQDLHAHVHLENNILFPKARALAAPAAG